MMRELTDGEKAIASEMAKAVGSEEERNQLMLDIQNCMVEDMVSDGSMLKFYISGYKRPLQHERNAFRGGDRFPVEGSIKDSDGAEVDVFIFSDKNNRILELELMKHAEGPVLSPNWDGFKLK